MIAVAAEQIMVTFKGEGAGVDELSWGQSENWSAIVSQKTWIPLGGVKPLDPGTTVEDIADELAYLMSRYQPMRTKLLFKDGRVLQEVFDSGEIALSIVDCADDPSVTAEAICDEWRASEMDFTAEWPVRMAVVRCGGELTHMAVLVSHLVTDATGAGVMMAEVARREAAPVSGMQPLEQARWQQSPAGRRQNASALRYWEGILRSIPPSRFPQALAEGGPRYWHGEFSSPAMLTALQRIVASSGLESTTVLLTLYSLALHYFTGINPVVIRPIVSNRFRPGLANVVCTLAQGGLCSLDVAGQPFGEALEIVQRSVLSAYKYAYFDHHHMVDLRSRVALDRGVEIDTSCYFNDRRSPGHMGSRAIEDPAEFRWIASQDAPSFEQLFVHIDDVPGTVQITIYLDTAYVPAAAGEALLRKMAAIALEAGTRMGESSP